MKNSQLVTNSKYRGSILYNQGERNLELTTWSSCVGEAQIFAVQRQIRSP